MKTKLFILFIGIIIMSCSNASKGDMLSYAAANNKTLVLANKTISETISEKSVNSSFKSYLDKLVKDQSEFTSYTLDDFTEIASIKLINGTTFLVKNGKYNHSGIIGKWIISNKKCRLKGQDYWLKQCEWISDRLLSQEDNFELKHLLKHRKYSVTQDKKKLHIEFNQNRYSKWYAIIDFGVCRDKGQVILETGYYN